MPYRKSNIDNQEIGIETNEVKMLSQTEGLPGCRSACTAVWPCRVGSRRGVWPYESGLLESTSSLSSSISVTSAYPLGAAYYSGVGTSLSGFLGPTSSRSRSIFTLPSALSRQQPRVVFGRRYAACRGGPRPVRAEVTLPRAHYKQHSRVGFGCRYLACRG